MCWIVAAETRETRETQTDERERISSGLFYPYDRSLLSALLSAALLCRRLVLWPSLTRHCDSSHLNGAKFARGAPTAEPMSSILNLNDAQHRPTRRTSRCLHAGEPGLCSGGSSASCDETYSGWSPWHERFVAEVLRLYPRAPSSASRILPCSGSLHAHWQTSGQSKIDR